MLFIFCKQKTAYEMRISDWSSDVCSSDLDGALGGTGTHEGVELVDEQDDVAAGADLLEHLLEALLEVAAVARAGHERTEVERVELLVLQRLGDAAGDDLLGQPLDDPPLPDAGPPDPPRVVLLPAPHHPHPPPATPAPP